MLALIIVMQKYMPRTEKIGVIRSILLNIHKLLISTEAESLKKK